MQDSNNLPSTSDPDASRVRVIEARPTLSRSSRSTLQFSPAVDQKILVVVGPGTKWKRSD